MSGPGSRGFHFNRQSETCAPDLVLKREPYKLSFALVKGLSKASGPLWTDRSSSLLNVTKVRPRNSKKLRKLRKASLVRFAQTRECRPESQRPSHEAFKVLRRFSPAFSLRLPSSHVC